MNFFSISQLKILCVLVAVVSISSLWASAASRVRAPNFSIAVLNEESKTYGKDAIELILCLTAGMSPFDRDRLFESAGAPETYYRLSDKTIGLLWRTRSLSYIVPNSELMMRRMKMVERPFYSDADTFIMRTSLSRFIGFLITGMRKELSGDRRVRSCMLYVDELYRRKGYATKLFKHMVQVLKEKGQDDISFCMEKSDPACALWYDKLEGFKREDFSVTEYMYTLMAEKQIVIE